MQRPTRGADTRVAGSAISAARRAVTSLRFKRIPFVYAQAGAAGFRGGYLRMAECERDNYKLGMTTLPDSFRAKEFRYLRQAGFLA